MQPLRAAVTLVLALVIFSSCDQGPGYENITEKTPGIKDFTIDPGELDFEPDDGIVDSLTTFSIQVTPEDPDNRQHHPRLVIRPQDEEQVYFETDINQWDDEAGLYDQRVQVVFFTAQVRNYEAYVYIPKEQQLGNRGQKTIKVNGFSAEPPVIEEVDHPETVEIPDAGESQFLIAAKATHPFGADNIGLVEVEIVDSNDNSIGQFELERELAEEAGYGDDWYATGFSVNEDNSSEQFTLFFYAEDTAGGVSDTLTSEMEFVQ